MAEDQTLNQKINKVIADIKRLNVEKSLKYGCTSSNHSSLKQIKPFQDTHVSFQKQQSSKDQSFKSDSRDESSDHLIEFIKRERKLDQQRNESQKYFTQQQSQNYQSHNNYQPTPKNNHNEDASLLQREDDLSSLFDLTSAKQHQSNVTRKNQDSSFRNQQQKAQQQQQYQTNSGSQFSLTKMRIDDIPELQSQNFYSLAKQQNLEQIAQNKYQSSKQLYQKYENILAAPGSIIVDAKGHYKTKTLYDELKHSHTNNKDLPFSSQIEDSSIKDIQVQISNPSSSQLQQENEELERLKKICQRTEKLLQNEQTKNKDLEQEFQRQNQAQQMIQDLVEQQEIANELRQKQIQRMSQKNAQLQKNLIKEKCLKENIAQRVNGYSNPAKLMNYIKMKKSIENSQFQDVNQYLTHLEAFSKISNKQSQQERDYQRSLLSKISSKNNENNKNLSNRDTFARKSNAFSSKAESRDDQNNSSLKDAYIISEELTLKQKLESQRKALRDFANYYQLNSN
ncbi:UNKNOWN [Stylonychia lemnae]|uniref:Uncharacterized protein n=1 Tax=Stylonychia lemnae TaxID=5949 RepID=A0A077ZV35_STYLE|nr:UNKNOWN [Stylonychia lemnae]|eukprot:CDW73749.1 UNKNOWN [Stylonychia lemnae]